MVDERRHRGGRQWSNPRSRSSGWAGREETKRTRRTMTCVVLTGLDCFFAHEDGAGSVPRSEDARPRFTVARSLGVKKHSIIGLVIMPNYDAIRNRHLVVGPVNGISMRTTTSWLRLAPPTMPYGVLCSTSSGAAPASRPAR